MTTAKEREALRKLLARIEKCSGECGKCSNLAFATGSDGLNAYFAVGCALASNFCPIADSPKQIKPALIDQLKFELKVV